MYTPQLLERIVNRLCPIATRNGEESVIMIDMICSPDFVYNNFEQVIIEYKMIQKEGGWPKLLTKKTLRLGTVAPDVLLLSQRLSKSGDLVHDHTSNKFDEILDASVKLFQERHGLVVDGIVGRNTKAALNTSVEDRITQLERAKAEWDKIPKCEKKVVVNVPGFRTIGTDANGHVSLDMKTIVGDLKHKTPVFEDEIEYAIVNPFWNVPYSISTKEILPEIKKAQLNGNVMGYFDKHRFQVRRRGAVVNPARINWTYYGTSNFPFTLHQLPSSKNALGLAKFIFPNRHSVYLHDTPGKSLFNHAKRAFSHGCMRLEQWRLMFEFLFPAYDSKDLDEILLTGKETKISLEDHVPVYVTYITAWVDRYGHVFFYNDIYDKY